MLSYQVPPPSVRLAFTIYASVSSIVRDAFSTPLSKLVGPYLFVSQLVCPACLQFQPGTETGTGSPYFCKGPSATAPSDSSLSPSPITSFLHHSYFYPASSPSSTTLGFPSRLFIEFPQARGGASFTVVLSRTNSLHRRQVVSGTSVPNSCHQAGLHSGSRFTSALSQRGQSGVSHRDPRSCTRSPSPLPISKGKQNRAQLF